MKHKAFWTGFPSKKGVFDAMSVHRSAENKWNNSKDLVLLHVKGLRLVQARD